ALRAQDDREVAEQARAEPADDRRGRRAGVSSRDRGPHFLIDSAHLQQSAYFTHGALSHPRRAPTEGGMEHYTAMIRRVGRQYRRSDADGDEVLQEVRIRLWRTGKLGQVTTSYVYRTSVTAAIDILRRRRARCADRTVALDTVEVPTAEAADPVERSELAARL